jgi:hypothetical protein
MSPTVRAGGFSWPADRAAERSEGIRLGRRPAVHGRRAQRSERFHEGAQPGGGVLGRESSGQYCVEGGIPDRGYIAVRWPREGRHVTIASSGTGHGVTPGGKETGPVPASRG